MKQDVNKGSKGSSVILTVPLTHSLGTSDLINLLHGKDTETIDQVIPGLAEIENC